MSVSKVLCAFFAVAIAASLWACSLITDFDPNKLAGAGTGGAGISTTDTGPAAGFRASGGAATNGGAPANGGADGSGGATTGGGVPGAGGSTGGDGGAAGDTSRGGAATGGAGGAGGSPAQCNVATNAGCAADELCCPLGNGVTCRKTSTKECEKCGVACPAGLTATCTARACQCEVNAGRPCSGKSDELFCVNGPPTACAECRDATDCAAHTDGKTRCVAGRCAMCDPAQTNAGCTGDKPICDAVTHTCKACTTSPNDCPKPLVCTAAGTCASCSKAADCTSATSPICDPTTTLCRPCASNTECASGPKLPYCIERTCSSCNPSTEAGCTDPTKPDCRGDATGHFSCQACTNDGNCANLPRTPACDANTGRCVACVLDNDCDGNAPFCINNVCTPCDSSTPIALVADLRCALKAGGQPVCVRNGVQKGQCGACDPGDARGCTNNQLCCDSSSKAACVPTSVALCAACSSACDPLVANACANRACRCGSNAPCSGTGSARFCIGGTCGECRTDADCTNAAAPLCQANACVGCNSVPQASSRCAMKATGSVCATSGPLAGRCASCDPATNAGCTNAALNQCDPATLTCVDCIDNRGCSGTFDRCSVSTHTCIDCDSTGGCADVPAHPICAASACRACATDAECASVNAGAPLCAGSGTCVPDAPCRSNTECTDGVHRVCVGLGADAGSTGHCRVCDPASGAGCVTGTCTAAHVCSG